MSIKLSYEDLIIITGISTPQDFSCGLRADTSGVWANRPERPELLTPTELDALRPSKGWDEPIVRFPCSPDEMRCFFEEACMEECNESLDAFLERQSNRALINSEREPAVFVTPRISSDADSRTYTRHEVATFLNTTPEIVFNMMTGEYVNPATGIKEVKIHPSIIRNELTSMHRVGVALPEKLSGIFGIAGFALVWGADDTARVAFEGRNRVLLYRDEFTYIVTEPFDIHKDELIITADDLDNYRRQANRQLKFPHDEMEQPQEFAFPIINVDPVQAECSPPFSIDEYLKSYRMEIKCARLKCHNCNKRDCRGKLAHELFSKFGNHTLHHLHLCKIGVALGLPEPTWATDRDDKEQMERQKKEVGAIKSCVRRWIKARKIVTPSHLTVTP